MSGSRVMTYNIFMGGRNGRPLHEVVRDVSPDVLMVNESPKFPIIWKRQCLKLAASWHMQFVGGGRRAGSNMITVGGSVRVKAVHTEVFDTPFLKPRRGLVAVQLRQEGRLFGAVACHLSLEREQRRQEVEKVIEVANRLRGPVMVGGDLNEQPNGASWKRLRQAGFVDHGNNEWLTFPADSPETRIDALLIRGGAKVVHHGDPGLAIPILRRASDHRPVLAVVEL